MKSDALTYACQCEGAIPVYEGLTPDHVFFSMAMDLYATIENNNNANKKTVAILPVGPVGQYPYFVSLVNTFSLSLKNTWFINMDEYLDETLNYISMESPYSFRGFMEREVYSKIQPQLCVPPAQRIFPDPKNTAFIKQLIADLGGVDVCYGGIGMNGHIAFNEPEPVTAGKFSTRQTRILPVHETTKATNALALAPMPSHCITIGMEEILSAEKIRLYCFRDWHKEVVAKTISCLPMGEFPASVLQGHPDVTITISKATL